MSKQYKVRTLPGFNAAQRVRGGITVPAGETITVELDKDQLAAIKADAWLEVKPAGGKEDTTPEYPVTKDGIVYDRKEDGTFTAISEDTGKATPAGEGDSEEAAFADYNAKKEASMIEESERLKAEQAAKEGTADGSEGEGDQDGDSAGEGSESGSDEGSEGDEAEEVELSEDMTIEQLQTIGKQAGVKNAQSYKDKKKLIAAIEKAAE